ncbi:hypothetical protein V1264_003813 [Littorina saxatilis]|uniref:Uncharacterized protein n=2 Tax=Littorina saxatilis TaxID=31220 RepID=A0AAN9B057_9CAEN
MERILTELHHGNFNPIVPLSDLSTPEQEEPPSLPADSCLKQITPIPQASQRNTPTSSKATTPVGQLMPARKKGPLELSRISLIGTPMINRPCSEIFDDDLFHFTPKYPARGKVMTSSANDLLEEKPPKQQEENTQEEHQKPLHAAVDLMKPTTPPIGHHHRSRSDLTDSILIQNKWLKYEEIKRKERKNLEGENAPLAEPESSLTLATLNLEDMRARRRVSDQMQLNTGPVLFMPQGHKDRKGDKKGGIGSFFSRLSRAVLKPRNATTNVEINILRPSQLPEKGKTTKASSEGVDKENFVGGAEDPKRSSKRMGRFRLNKQPA